MRCHASPISTNIPLKPFLYQKPFQQGSPDKPTLKKGLTLWYFWSAGDNFSYRIPRDGANLPAILYRHRFETSFPFCPLIIFCQPGSTLPTGPKKKTNSSWSRDWPFWIGFITIFCYEGRDVLGVYGRLGVLQMENKVWWSVFGM